ncbi:MAG: 16S rRNA (adenine(1518)-N(6)/adenine(1519)-N(6))-dimethyltransferase RsmA [Buchnera aphidicola (Nurudea shiraii)]
MIKLRNNIYKSKKFLGQNFLIDKCVIKHIISRINPQKKDVMIEIGPGLGALTYDISKFPCKLFLIEYDKDLAYKLFLFYRDMSNVKIFSENALKFDFLRVRKNFELIRIFGNLPYNVSVALLCYFFTYYNIIFDMHLMFQKEVADRLLAVPGTKNYGRLSVISQYFYNITNLLDVFPRSFRPIPKVNSNFLRFTIHKKNKNFVKNVSNLQKITTLAFSKRRKMIKNSLFELFSEDVLTSLDIDPKCRAENLSITQYCILSNYIS